MYEYNNAKNKMTKRQNDKKKKKTDEITKHISRLLFLFLLTLEWKPLQRDKLKRKEGKQKWERAAEKKMCATFNHLLKVLKGATILKSFSTYTYERMNVYVNVSLLSRFNKKKTL